MIIRGKADFIRSILKSLKYLSTGNHKICYIRAWKSYCDLFILYDGRPVFLSLIVSRHIDGFEADKINMLKLKSMEGFEKNGGLPYWLILNLNQRRNYVSYILSNKQMKRIQESIIMKYGSYHDIVVPWSILEKLTFEKDRYMRMQTVNGFWDPDTVTNKRLKYSPQLLANGLY